ncbi:hypothetical protein [Streptomyces sp. NPDC048639]|uniref:hypothetical protein n=1 Tax=Streptomyces sp. NPDC048639 TaxID=3365581 RepID=UPI0037185325
MNGATGHGPATGHGGNGGNRGDGSNGARYGDTRHTTRVWGQGGEPPLHGTWQPGDPPMELEADTSLDVTVELEQVRLMPEHERARSMADTERVGSTAVSTLRFADAKRSMDAARATGAARASDAARAPDAPRVSGETPVPDEARLRFGPGVPTGEAAASRQRGRKRARRRGFGERLRIAAPYVVILALLGLLAAERWPLNRDSLTVSGVDVAVDSGQAGCGSTVTVRGVVRTNGEAGELTYRWRRSDGTVSPPRKESVEDGQRTAVVEMSWSFDGEGTLKARAHLEVTSPGPDRRDSVGFVYRCTKKDR